MPKPKHHVLVCTNNRPPGHPRGSCGEKGSNPLLTHFMAEIEKNNLFGDVIVTGSTCVGPCPLGPLVIVYPDAVWYQKVSSPADVAAIVKEHIQEGKPVERLRFPDAMWG
ncbi:MAG: (2Fe-2S) ferredoxin domain-containing protein [Nitrospirae bacterium]|nr:(2Fe-2S) ferredoxin domain-containing protein [Nitrospirota bacterium]